MFDYIIYFRSFRGPGYWGSFKHTKCFSDTHAQQKLKRVSDGYFRSHPDSIGRGEFRIEFTSEPRLRIVLMGLRRRKSIKRYNRSLRQRV